MNADDLVRLLQQYRLRFGTEEQLQADVELLLLTEALPFEREVALPGAGRIDFFLPPWRLGIECKCAGGPSAVLRQCLAYAHHEAIDGLVLVASRRSLIFPEESLAGKPFRSLWIGGSGL